MPKDDLVHPGCWRSLVLALCLNRGFVVRSVPCCVVMYRRLCCQFCWQPDLVLLDTTERQTLLLRWWWGFRKEVFHPLNRGWYDLREFAGNTEVFSPVYNSGVTTLLLVGKSDTRLILVRGARKKTIGIQESVLHKTTNRESVWDWHKSHPQMREKFKRLHALARIPEIMNLGRRGRSSPAWMTGAF